MILVGHYHYKADGPSVWARSDGREVHYYYGREALVKVVKDEQKPKVYYSQPVSFPSDIAALVTKLYLLVVGHHATHEMMLLCVRRHIYARGIAC
jgi:hypothetical protein